MPENQELKSELGLRVTPIDEGIEEQTEDGVEEGEKHDRQSWHDDSPAYCRTTVGYSVRIFLTPQELHKLGVEVSASTIRRVLRQHRIPPAPRRSALTWRRFLAAHAATIVATDFSWLTPSSRSASTCSSWRAAASAW